MEVVCEGWNNNVSVPGSKVSSHDQIGDERVYFKISLGLFRMIGVRIPYLQRTVFIIQNALQYYASGEA